MENEKQKHDLQLMSFEATAATETSGGHASGTTSTGPETWAVSRCLKSLLQTCGNFQWSLTLRSSKSSSFRSQLKQKHEMCSSTCLISHVSVWVCKAKYPRFPLCCFLFAKKTISFKALTCFQSPKGFRLKTYGFVSNIKAPTMTWSCYVHIIWTIWLWQCSQQRLSGAILSFLGANVLVECNNMQEARTIPSRYLKKALRQGIDPELLHPEAYRRASQVATEAASQASQAATQAANDFALWSAGTAALAPCEWICESTWVPTFIESYDVVACQDKSQKRSLKVSLRRTVQALYSDSAWPELKHCHKSELVEGAARSFCGAKSVKLAILQETYREVAPSCIRLPARLRPVASVVLSRPSNRRKTVWTCLEMGERYALHCARHIKEASCGTLDCFPDASQAWIAWMFGLCKWLKMDVMNLSPQSCARVRRSMFWGRWFKQI